MSIFCAPKSEIQFMIEIVTSGRQDTKMDGVKMEKSIQLSEKEGKLLQIIRAVEYGEIHIIVKEGKPVRVEQIQKSIKLD